MRERSDILSEVLALNREIEERQEQIKELYKEAQEIEDPDDDADGRNSYLSCIQSYT